MAEHKSVHCYLNSILNRLSVSSMKSSKLASRIGVYFEPHLHQFGDLAKCVNLPDIFTTNSV